MARGFSRPNAYRCLLFVCLVGMLVPSAAHAVYIPIPYDLFKVLSWNSYCPDDDQHGIIERFVLCTRGTVTLIFYYFIYNLYPFFENLIYICLLLAVTLYGVRVVTVGIQNIARETVIFIIKIGCVVYFTANLDEVFGWATGIMDGLLNMVGKIAVLQPFGSNPSSMTQMSGMGALRCEFQPQPLTFDFGLSALIGGSWLSGAEWPFWKRIDCILDGIIGIKGLRFSQGMIAFFIYCAGSGVWGLMICLMGLIICFVLVMCALRSVQIYMISFILVAFMTIFGVMYLPAMLFQSEITQKMFKKWALLTGGYVMQPVLMFAFLSLLITVFDVLMFSGENSVMRTIAGDAAKDADFKLQDYLEKNQLYSTNSWNIDYVTDQSNIKIPASCTDKSGRQLDSGALGNVFCLTTGEMPASEALNSIKQGFDLKVVDWCKVGQTRKPAYPKQYTTDCTTNTQYYIAQTMIMAALAIYVFWTFMNMMPEIIGSLSSASDPDVKSERELSGSLWSLPGMKTASEGVSSVGQRATSMLGWRGK